MDGDPVLLSFQGLAPEPFPVPVNGAILEQKADTKPTELNGVPVPLWAATQPRNGVFASRDAVYSIAFITIIFFA
jgi:hypothetical protein